MRVRMLTTQAGSPDGLRTNTYEAGEVYDLPDSLTIVFVREGWAVNADFGDAQVPVEKKQPKKRR